MESYHKDRKRDKFDYAIMGIFICSIIVSFNHTIELYKSAGFHAPINWMNNSFTEQWLGKDFFTLALFATLAAEAAFTVGLWGLYEAFRMERKFPGLRYKWTWSMFFGGLIIVGWSNIGGTLGYNYLFGDPIKGLVLGLSVPYFVLNAVLVNFSRTMSADQTENEQHEQPKLTLWAASLANAVNTFREITMKPEHEHLNKEHHEQPKAEQTNHEHEHTRTTIHEQPDEQHEHAHDQQTERKQNEQPEHEQNKWPKHERSEHERSEHERPEHEQPEREQFEQNDEQAEREQIEQRKQSEREQRKRKLYIVNGHGRSKVDQAVQCALKMMERNEQFTVRELARMAGCSVATAQNALNRLKQQKQA